jgi:hypothetical protein
MADNKRSPVEAGLGGDLCGSRMVGVLGLASAS